VPGAGDIVRAGRLREAYDLVVVVDVAQQVRLGDVGKRIGEGQRVLVVDHHPEDAPFGAIGFVDPSYASCSEIVVDLYAAAGLTMSLEAATAAYVGLTTDTGSFRFSNTDVRAHRHAALLLGLGVNASDIASRVFDVISAGKLALLKLVLDRVQRSAGGRIAWAHLTSADIAAAHADAEDVEGLVNFVRNLDGVHVGVLFRELKPGRIKVSMRARSPINAGSILKPLGGGGHAGAAGAILLTPLDESMRLVVEQVESALGDAPKELADR
jgi:phosphoesterase RecJ-like protein